MIVKDEAHIIHESLGCTLPLVDTYCIVDTGSSDDTIAKIREFYTKHGIEGDVHERPWVDFGTNRTQALQLCDGKMDYALVIDADDLMSFPEGGRAELETLLEKDDPSGVQIRIKQSTIDYYRTQLFKVADKWRYVGVLHEYPASGVPNAKTVKLPNTFWMESRRLGGRTVAGNKLERDIAVLEKGLIDEPNNERYMFYLAQTYWDAGQNEKARAMYEKRFNHGGWAEETWFAAYRVGECHRRLGQIPEFELWMQKAHALRPWRAEPMYKLTEHFRSAGQCHKAYHYLQIGRKITYPKDDVLFVEKFPHEGGFDYEATIIDYYVLRERPDGLSDSVNYLLKQSTHSQNVVANLQFYVKPVGATFKPVSLPNPFGSEFRPSAISVIEYPYANVRYVNYSLPDYKGPDGTVTTNNAYVNLETGQIVRAFPLEPTPFETQVRGLEDLRLYRDTLGTLRFTATNYYAYEKDKVSIVTGVYGETHSDIVAVTSPTGARCEKNWVHIPGTDELIYSWHPLRTGRIVGSKLAITRTIETPPLFSLFRGSSAPFRSGTHWWALVHFVHYSSPRTYYHCFVELSPEFKVLRVSLPFVFKTVGIEYCISAWREGDTIVCYPSFKDANPERASFPMSEIKWVNVSTYTPPDPIRYWHGQYSSCSSTGGIHRYIESNSRGRPIVWIQKDGIFSAKNYDVLPRAPYVIRETEYDSTISSPNIIAPILASRGVSRDSMLYVPLDDETFEHGLKHVLSNIPSPKWNERKSLVFWRGAAGGFEQPSMRMRVVEKLFDHPSCDVRLTKWCGAENGRGIPEEHFGDRCGLDKHFLYKYILIIDGTCIASNHQWVFGSGSVPIMVTHPENNYWFKRYLKPMVNYVPIQYDLSDLREKIDWLVAHDEEARKIAENARSLADTAFTPDFQKQYISFELERRPHLAQAYENKYKTPSDINEHLPVLMDYAKKCRTIVECGSRGVVSSYAFASGLVGVADNSLVLVDPFKGADIEKFLLMCHAEGVNATYVQDSDLSCPLVETDLLFIDTLHVYAQLKRELAYWHSSVAKYIIMHDTTVDGEGGEVVRQKADADRLSRELGYPIDELKRGLWPAVEEFIAEHPEWVIEKRYTNNNGLTILSRCTSSATSHPSSEQAR